MWSNPSKHLTGIGQWKPNEMGHHDCLLTPNQKVFMHLELTFLGINNIDDVERVV